MKPDHEFDFETALQLCHAWSEVARTSVLQCIALCAQEGDTELKDFLMGELIALDKTREEIEEFINESRDARNDGSVEEQPQPNHSSLGQGGSPDILYQNPSTGCEDDAQNPDEDHP